MKTLDIATATGSLARFTKALHHEAVLVTERGKPLAALVPIENADLETATLSTHPQFLALIERARRGHKRKGGITTKEMRRRLGLMPAPRKSHRDP